MKNKFLKWLALAFTCASLSAFATACNGGSFGNSSSQSSLESSSIEDSTSGDSNSDSSLESDSSVEDSTSGDSNSDSSLESDGGVEDDSTNSTDSSAEPVETGLTFKTLTVNGTDAYGKFSNATEEFSFDNEIQTSGNSSYVVSNDKYGSQTYLINVVPLNCGENVYYIFEKSGTTVLNRFTITLYRRSMLIIMPESFLYKRTPPY